jgi:hypothetical protein
LNWGQESWLYGVPKSLHEYDSIQNTKSEHTRDGTLGQYFTRKLILLQQRSGENPMRFWQDYWRQMQDNIPKVIFILLPIFALLLKLLYIRQDFYYAEHLVFSIYFYDFMYLMGIVMLLASMVSWLEWISALLYIAIFLYLYKAMRHVYGQRRFKTIVKFFMLTGSFFFCIMLAFVINAVVTLILL